MPKKLDYRRLAKINKSLREIKESGYKPPTVKGKFFGESSSLFKEKKSDINYGEIRKKREFYKDLNERRMLAGSPKISYKQAIEVYDTLIESAEKYIEKYYSSVEQYRETESQKIYEILENNLHALEGLSDKEISALKSLSYDELLEVFNSASANSEKDNHGNFINYTYGNDGKEWKQYNEFISNLSKEIKERVIIPE